jgi:hypothetical protein
MASNKVPPPMFEEFFVGSVNELVFEVPGFFFFFFFFFELLTNGAIRVSPPTHAVNAILF